METNFNGAQIGGGPGRSDLSLWGGSLDLLGVMNRNGWVSPYVSVGLGGVQNDVSPGRNSTDFMSQAGVGMFLKLWESTDGSRSFSLRPDLKARWDDAGSAGKLRDYIGTIGFQYSFGAAKAEPPPPPPAPPPVAAAPTPPPPPAPPADSDGRRCDGQPGSVPRHARRCGCRCAGMPAQGLHHAGRRGVRGELGNTDG